MAVTKEDIYEQLAALCPREANGTDKLPERLIDR